MTLVELDNEMRRAMEGYHAGWVEAGREAYPAKDENLWLYDRALLWADNDADLAWKLFRFAQTMHEHWH